MNHMLNAKSSTDKSCY